MKPSDRDNESDVKEEDEEEKRRCHQHQLAEKQPEETEEKRNLLDCIRAKAAAWWLEGDAPLPDDEAVRLLDFQLPTVYNPSTWKNKTKEEWRIESTNFKLIYAQLLGDGAVADGCAVRAAKDVWSVRSDGDLAPVFTGDVSEDVDDVEEEEDEAAARWVGDVVDDDGDWSDRSLRLNLARRFWNHTCRMNNS